MRLMLVIAELAAGGAESVVIDLAADAAGSGDEVAVVAAPGPLDARLEGIDLTRLPLPAQSAGPLRMPLTVAPLRSALRAFRPDLIHAHNPRITAAVRVARAFAAMRDVPLLATYHGVAPERARNAGRALHGAARIACVSEPLRAELAAGGAPADRLVVVRNGTAAAPPLDPARRASLDADLGLGDGPVVSAVGRLVPQKNHARFLSAVARAAPELPDARFLVVGDGVLRGELEAQARSLDLGERLTLTGVRSDARDLIARSDLLVLSSDWEGFPLVALEGLAAGVPLLSTPVAGIEELTAAGAAESVAADSEALAAGLIDLLRDRGRLNAMGERARELHAREFSVERMVADYRGLYEALA
jgi:glycosyltransferase involved in cell wall biosynthesis